MKSVLYWILNLRALLPFAANYENFINDKIVHEQKLIASDKIYCEIIANQGIIVTN